MKKILVLISLVFLVNSLYAQQQEYELGSSFMARYNQQTGFFDLSDPETLNMVVSLWGFVKYPGRYLVPINTLQSYF